MKQLLQSSKSSVSSAIQAVGLNKDMAKDMAKTAAQSAAAAAIQSVVPTAFAAATAVAPKTAAAVAPPPKLQVPTSATAAVAATAPPPPPAPYFYPPYYYNYPPQVPFPEPFLPSVQAPREPVYPSTKVGVSRVERISDNVAAADLHHIGPHPHPFYKQRWFIILMIILAVGILIGTVVGIYLYVRHKDNTDPNKDVPGVPAY